MTVTCKLKSSILFLQNRLASSRTEPGGKVCSVTGPSVKTRAALGEIGNVAVDKEQRKVPQVTFFFFFNKNGKMSF